MKKWYLVGFVDENKPSKIIHEENPKMLYQGGEINYQSPGYKTKKELINNCKILEEPCRCCGAPVATNYSNNEPMIERNLCFSCNFWEDKKSYINRPNIFIIEGVFYSDGGRQERDSFLGFGGREFRIKTNDGRFISTNNLWCGSSIPEKFRDVLKDNAEFITEEEYQESI